MSSQRRSTKRKQYSQSRNNHTDQSDDDDDEPSGSTQRGTPSQQNNQYSKLSTDVQEQLVKDCVSYLLIVNQKGYPIKKQDIVKQVLKEHSRTFPVVISRVTAILKNVFGISLVEVPNKKGIYLLINKLDFKFPETDSPLQLWSDPECAHHGLLFIILTVIFMNGNVITEALLWQFLKKLGLDVESDRPHSLFGSVKKLICQEFVRKLYLELKLVPGSDPVVYEFRLGPRAILETSKKDMIEFVSKLYKTRPEQWASQYQEALASENDNPD